MSPDEASSILVVTGYYLPGHKAGGPIRSISNLVALLGDEFTFLVATSDRDLGETQPYISVVPDAWQAVGKAQVRYLSPDQQSPWAWRWLLHTTPCDLIYLNSYFSRLTVFTLVLRRLRLIPEIPIVLAPRGEFSSGALALKPRKKRLYRRLSDVCALTAGVIWHASSEQEAADIRRESSHWSPIVATSPDAPDRVAPSAATSLPAIEKRPGGAKIVFLSRISPMKNLEFAIETLIGMSHDVEFDIYGPREDAAYWKVCEKRLTALPHNVRVRCLGPVDHEDVRSVMSQYHLFFLPTKGENFGHAILEALSAGCPVLISDRTPWRSLASREAGWDLPLEKPETFRAALESVVAMDQAEWAFWSAGARSVAEVYAKDPTVIQANRDLFRFALGRRNGTFSQINGVDSVQG